MSPHGIPPKVVKGIAVGAIVLALIVLGSFVCKSATETEAIGVGKALLRFKSLGTRLRPDDAGPLPHGSPIELLESLAAKYGDIGKVAPTENNPLPDFLLPGAYHIPERASSATEADEDPILVFAPRRRWTRSDVVYVLLRNGSVASAKQPTEAGSRK